jgi:hypothetical protein
VKKIGGMFCLEEAATARAGTPFIESLGGEDLRFCMSGRCAIYYCLLDVKKTDTRRIAYLPAYTCETVVAPYKKAGYALRFYDVSPEELTPRFDRSLIPHISVLGLCGYYGFSRYDRDFVGECVDAGVAVIQDITHSAFSSGGIEERAAYTAGSLRKWIGIASGGIAVKRRGSFDVELLPAEEEHIRGRFKCFAERERTLSGEAGASDERVEEIFWETELRLRKIFDVYESDSLSAHIIRNLFPEALIKRRRENYAYILSRHPFGPRLRPVFPSLDEGVCPSHMSLYAQDRDAAQHFLAKHGISSTFYWPFPGETNIASYPGTDYICGHIFSVPLDQRYSAADMDLLCSALDKLKEPPYPLF